MVAIGRGAWSAATNPCATDTSLQCVIIVTYLVLPNRFLVSGALCDQPHCIKLIVYACMYMFSSVISCSHPFSCIVNLLFCASSVYVVLNQFESQ